MKLFKREAYQQAAEQFRLVVEAVPKSSEDRALYANALVHLGRSAEAIEHLKIAVTHDPGNFRVHAFLGQVLAKSGQAIEAIDHYTISGQLCPDERVDAELQTLKAFVTKNIHSWHLLMLSDTARNDAFQAAIEAVVQPDDLVLDIGTGTGLLAMMAARAGARQVIACETRPELAALARTVIGENGLASRITVIGKHSTELVVGVDLPRPATVLVSETFDSILIGEGALNTFRHARRALLDPAARMIPSRGVIRAMLAATPQLKAMHPLRSLNGFNFRGLARYALQNNFYPVKLGIEPWTALSDPFDVVAFDFADNEALLDRTWTIPVPVTAAGTVQSVMLWFDLQLSADIGVSSGPGGRLTHWSTIAFLLDAEKAVAAGDLLRLEAEMGGGERIYFTV